MVTQEEIARHFRAEQEFMAFDFMSRILRDDDRWMKGRAPIAYFGYLLFGDQFRAKDHV
jgi:hypothetical protein